MSHYDLSIVVVGRNDDHGLNFFDRMIACMDFNRTKLLDAGISAEFIFVDWAFDPEKPLFSELIREKLPWWDTAIAVSAKWQEHLKENPRLAFMEFIAKNVGIRRAKAEFILSTNCDIFFSKNFVNFIATKKWCSDVLYRAVRIDLKMSIGINDVDYDVLEHPGSVSHVNWAFPPLYTNASGDMQFMSRDLWHKVRGFNEEVRYTKVHKDSNLCACIHRKHKVPIVLAGQIYHFEHGMSLNIVQGQYGPNNELAPYGPDWNWEALYNNTPDWGLGDQPVKPYNGDDSVQFIDFPQGLE